MCLIIFTVLEIETLFGGGNKNIETHDNIYLLVHFILCKHSFHTISKHLKRMYNNYNI